MDACENELVYSWNDDAEIPDERCAAVTMALDLSGDPAIQILDAEAFFAPATTCCEKAIESEDPDLLVSCPKVKDYSWDNVTRECAYDLNAHFWSSTGDTAGDFGLTLDHSEADY